MREIVCPEGHFVRFFRQRVNAIFRVGGLFSSLAACGIKHRLSFFADDVVLRIIPSIREATSVVELLRIFVWKNGPRAFRWGHTTQRNRLKEEKWYFPILKNKWMEDQLSMLYVI
jgi:hypothetical protein